MRGVRKPRGFTTWPVPAGALYGRREADGRWVILAGEPDVKLDNWHGDRRPHLHVRGWDSTVRRDLRTDLTIEEAVAAVARQLAEQGYLDPRRLLEDLG